MIDSSLYQECDPLENVIVLVHEADFLAFATKPENHAYRFVNHEYHPDPKKNQPIAHHFYVIDVHSKHVFGHVVLKISADEYAELGEKFEN